MNIWSGNVMDMKFAVNSGPTSNIGNKAVINIIIINMILNIIISFFIFNGKTPVIVLSLNHRRKKLLRQRWQGA
jgi:hypothetical protein